jgi:hypothetical protein
MPLTFPEEGLFRVVLTKALHVWFNYFLPTFALQDKFLKGQCHEIFDFRFFHESGSPKSLSIPYVAFQIFSKIRGDICSSRCTNWTPLGRRVNIYYKLIFSFKFTLRCLIRFPLFATGINNTSGTGGKI